MDIVNVKLALETLNEIVPAIKMDQIKIAVRQSIIDYHEERTDVAINKDLDVVGIPSDEMELKAF